VRHARDPTRFHICQDTTTSFHRKRHRFLFAIKFPSEQRKPPCWSGRDSKAKMAEAFESEKDPAGTFESDGNAAPETRKTLSEFPASTWCCCRLVAGSTALPASSVHTIRSTFFPLQVMPLLPVMPLTKRNHRKVFRNLSIWPVRQSALG
jgi:hypothetical protein